MLSLLINVPALPDCSSLIVNAPVLLLASFSTEIPGFLCSTSFFHFSIFKSLTSNWVESCFPSINIDSFTAVSLAKISFSIKLFFASKDGFFAYSINASFLWSTASLILLEMLFSLSVFASFDTIVSGFQYRPADSPSKFFISIE